MRRFAVILGFWSMLLPALGAVAPAQQAPSFMAYGASAATKQLIAVRFQETEGKLEGRIQFRRRLDIEAAPVVFNAEQRLLYVASLRAKDGETNQLKVISIDEQGAANNNTEFPLKHGCAYLSLDRTGRFLLSASYFDGHVDVYRLKDGVPEAAVSQVFEDRDKAHSILTTPDNRFAYVPYVKDQNALFQYGFDAETGKLSPLAPLRAETPSGVGPRHVAFHPKLPRVYFSNEQHLGVTAYSIGKDGQLKLAQVCQPGTLKPAEGVAASDIKITPDGKLLFVGVRDFANGKIDAIHRYRVGWAGKLTHLGSTKADAIPWGLQLSPDGRHLLVTASRGATLAAFEIGEDGSLTSKASVPWGEMIRAIAVVPLKQ